MKMMTDTECRLAQVTEGATLLEVRSGNLTVDVEVVLPGQEGSSKAAARMRKILEVRRALQQGSYVVDCERLADVLLRRAGRIGEEAKSGYSA